MVEKKFNTRTPDNCATASVYYEELSRKNWSFNEKIYIKVLEIAIPGTAKLKLILTIL